MIELNETPVRTARNFNINNIRLENVLIPEKIDKFDNVKITGDCLIDANISETDLVYGLGESFINQVKSNANVKTRIILEEQKNRQVEMKFDFDEMNTSLVENIEIIAEKNSTATVVLKYNSKEGIDIYHNGVVRLFAKENSKVNIILVNLLNTNSNNFLSIENTVLEKAKVNYYIVDFGGKNSITNYYSNLVGNESNNKINCIYLGKENQVFDLNYIGELRGEKSEIDIDVQGALKDHAKKHFKGTIDFKRGCKKAKGNENEFCILLSDTAKSIALPMLLCGEEDVEGNHSFAAGKIDENQLFYIMSRGFNYKEAMKLIVKAKFNKILESIDVQHLKKEIINEIDERLD